MIKAIFFDLGDVLVKEGYTTGINEYEIKNKIPKNKLYAVMHDFDYWKDFTLGKITESEYFAAVKNNFKGEIDISELKKIIFNNFILNHKLIDFVRLLKKKYIIGIISNNPKEWFDYCFKNFGWKDLFDVKIISGYVHIRKPEKEIFQLALDEAKILGEESVYIDDRLDRTMGAVQANMNVIVFKDLNNLKSEVNKILE